MTVEHVKIASAFFFFILTKMDYGDLKDDKDIQEKLGNLHKSVEKIEDMLKATLKPELYETMDLKQKVDYDLFMGYTLNTLFWLYMKTKGLDPGQSELKTQLNRIKQYMIQAKQVSKCLHYRFKANIFLIFS